MGFLCLLTIVFGDTASARELPQVRLVDVGVDGCGVPAIRAPDRGWRKLRGGAPGFCVHAVLAARLETGAVADVVLQLWTGEPGQGERIFIYELDGEVLVPRYLASGSTQLALVSVERWPGVERDSLLLNTTSASGVPRALYCGFVEFPLLCGDSPKALGTQVEGL